MTLGTIALALIGPTVTIAICGVGGLMAFERLKSTVITRKECIEVQGKCRDNVCRKIDEVKALVITLHENQKADIKAADNKRDAARTEYFESINRINTAIGRIQGHLEIRDK